MDLSDLIAALGSQTSPAARLPVDTGPATPVVAHINRLADQLAAAQREAAALRQALAEQRQAQAALVAARDAALAANRSKSQFLASMSHELRTPLNAIIGYSELLQEELGPEAAPDLKTIHAAGKHLLALINDVLDLAKIEAGKMELFPASFDVSEVLDDVARTVQPLVAKRGNTLAIERPADLGTMVADSMRLKQCLLNLLSNAAKFAENSVITLDVSATEVSGRPWLAFRVMDRGPGMSPEQLSHLFRPFEQGGDSAASQAGGTGLGLTISRRFCEMMGGEITAVSALGAGATFTIRLPRAPTDPSVASAPGAPASCDGLPAKELVEEQPTALVIDDDPHVREVMRRYLTGAGWNTVGAESGAQGLELARTLRPNAITLDVIMPEMDGWAVLSALKADPELRATPVVMVTMMDDRRMGYALGAAEMLSKPVERAALHQVLLRLRHGAPSNVLVVDDDEVTRVVHRRLLESEGCRVTEAANGRLALESLCAGVPDLILLDLLMPELDGFQFVRELQRQPAWRDIPVIVVTAQDLCSEERRQLTAGVEGILSKDPDDHVQLLSQVQAALRSSLAQPATSAPVQFIPAHPPPATVHRGARVLVVDDNSVNRRLAARMIERLGHTVTLAASGEETIAAVQGQTFDVVFLDLEMPGLDGLATAAALRTSGYAEPIVAMTAHSDDESREACQAAGMNDFITKPFEREEIAAKIERWQAAAVKR